MSVIAKSLWYGKRARDASPAVAGPSGFHQVRVSLPWCLVWLLLLLLRIMEQGVRLVGAECGADLVEVAVVGGVTLLVQSLPLRRVFQE